MSTPAEERGIDPAAVHVHVEQRFAQIPEELLYDPNISHAAVRLYGVLLRHGADPQNCYPSHARIAACMGASKRSVPAWVRELEEAGWIRRVTRWRKGDRYVASPEKPDPSWEPATNGYQVFARPRPPASAAAPPPRPVEVVDGPAEPAAGTPAEAPAEVPEPPPEGVRAGERVGVRAEERRGVRAGERVGTRSGARGVRAGERAGKRAREREQRNERTRSADADRQSPPPLTLISEQPSDETFERLWVEGCWRKVHKAEARRAWARATRRANPRVIREAAIAHKRRMEEVGVPMEFRPHMATWLNADGWEDDPVVAYPDRRDGHGRGGRGRPVTWDETRRGIEAMRRRLSEAG